MINDLVRLFDWSFPASQPYDDFICVAYFLHFKVRVNSVSTSIKKIIINVLKMS